MKFGIILLIVFVAVLADAASAADCDSRPDMGPCPGFFPRYYFDKATGSCKRFVYGGCQGNGNNYLTLSNCNRACSGSG